MSTETTVTEAEAAVINKDPFAPVRLTRIVDNRGRATDKFMVELQAEDSEDWINIPGVGAVHSSKYRLVSNRTVHDMGQKVMQKTGLEFEPLPGMKGQKAAALTWNGRSYVERWYTKGVKVMSPQGTEIMLGLEVRNSYDDACKVGLAFFAMHTVCQNQFHSGKLLGEPFQFGHIGDSGELDGDFESAIGALEDKATNFARIVPHLNALMEAKVEGLNEFLELRDRMNAITGVTLRDRELMDELSGHGITGKLGITRADGTRPYGDPSTLWAIMNACTAITTHAVGGLRGSDQASRVTDFLLREASAR